MTEPSREPIPNGLPHAIGAYFIWGLLPLYMATMRHVPALEFVGWRVLFTLPFCLAIVLLRKQMGSVLDAVRNPKTLGLLFLSALLIGCNWLIYVLAIQSGHVLAASLGYYINPLVNVLLGTIFLGERLSRLQWAAVVLAGAGVSLLAWDARDMLSVSLGLALTFSFYGLVRKFVAAESLPGLTVESALLVLPAVVAILLQAATPAGPSLGHGATNDLLIAFSGIATATPLLLFAVAARRMDYSMLGFIQFFAPTIMFLLGLFVFHEPLRHVQVLCFVAIWSAIGLFVWDLLRKRFAQQHR